MRIVLLILVTSLLIACQPVHPVSVPVPAPSETPTPVPEFTATALPMPTDMPSISPRPIMPTPPAEALPGHGNAGDAGSDAAQPQPAPMAPEATPEAPPEATVTPSEELPLPTPTATP